MGKIKDKRKKNPIAKSLSNPLFKQRIIKSKKLYNRKEKLDTENNSEPG